MFIDQIFTCRPGKSAKLSVVLLWRCYCLHHKYSEDGKKSIGLVRFPPWGGAGRGLTAYLVYKPLPATSHPTAPLPWGGN